ncbi:MAG: DUF3536 domain-containing protein, partial [Candidatus Omnitrophica bacterium]|nr:DUF3536 domain-containing protein [Candidatus Omnitrophota bacterium]
SFNVGPTLLSWLEKKCPSAYQAIIKADQKSCLEHGGHGNALAQVYNHMIMPLAHLRDQVTQVKWGIQEFKYRYARNPEGMWLPETACNEDTLEVLANEGIKFTVLAPQQAERVKNLRDRSWHDVSSGIIDPRFPYRLFIKGNPDKFIDLFFYDGSIARELSFGSLAFEAKYFADALDHARAKTETRAQLIHVATDGETFGHHKAFGERALAYLLNVEAPKRGYRIVNYGEFLESHPPRFEVHIKKGEDGDGTSWSCAHGVKRWKGHCGCHTGGPAGWNQRWRKPLRESLNWLRDELVKIYELYGAKYLKDVWAARNNYIQMILNRSDKTQWEFFERHATRQLTHEEVDLSLKLLDMQHYAMLMYTSCGWFFNDISGIETVQILRYAARAIELTQQVTGKSFEEEFAMHLTKAKSNVHEFKTGQGVYKKLVKPIRTRHCERSEAI